MPAATPRTIAVRVDRSLVSILTRLVAGATARAQPDLTLEAGQMAANAGSTLVLV